MENDHLNNLSLLNKAKDLSEINLGEHFPYFKKGVRKDVCKLLADTKFGEEILSKIELNESEI
jgi:hypothetical protein